MNLYLDFVTQHWILFVSAGVVILAIMVYELYMYSVGPARISPQEAVHLMNRESAVVIDLRDKDIFNKGHIVQSINVPKQELERGLDKITAYRDRMIILVCGNGQHALQLAPKLLQSEFKNTKVLSGGIQAWKDAGLPIEKK